MKKYGSITELQPDWIEMGILHASKLHLWPQKYVQILHAKAKKLLKSKQRLWALCFLHYAGDMQLTAKDVSSSVF